jgi:hypothetical protein
MSQEVKFQRETNFTGRNGFFKCSGVDVTCCAHSRTAMLTPLTSRGALARCDIFIPAEDIDALIAALQAIKEEMPQS